jgi:UDP-glucose 4-epimerase
MTILIIGSEGFIGSNAVRYFKNKGFKVITADISGINSREHWLLNPDKPDFDSIFENGIAYDFCINASGAANVQFSFQQPHVDFLLNVGNVYNLLDSLRRHNPACKFINFSSAAVYGNPDELPIKESFSTHPLSPYGSHKLYSEAILKEFYTFFKIPVVSLRIFSAYGEGLCKQLFWDIYKKALQSENERIEVFGTGNESRDFIYIRDLVRAIEYVMVNSAFKGECINIASGIETPIKEAICYFIKEVDPQINVEFTGTEKIGDPSNWVADISSLRKMGFAPEYLLNQGLSNTAAWLKANHPVLK